MNASLPSGGSSPALRRILGSLNCDGSRGIALVVIFLALLAPELGGEGARSALRYDRSALGAGEWWRLLTGHLVHLDLEHAVLNALGLVLMWALFARDYAARAWLLIVVTSIAAIDAGFWFRDTNLEWYVGSSGALHGVMTAGTLAHVLRRDLDGWILAAFIVVKLAFEQATGALPFAEGDSSVVVNAHLYGALGGLLGALLLRIRTRVGRTQPL
jgi:rhomboid family GlyGly-CTERM serine protease